MWTFGSCFHTIYDAEFIIENLNSFPRFLTHECRISCVNVVPIIFVVLQEGHTALYWALQNCMEDAVGLLSVRFHHWRKNKLNPQYVQSVHIFVQIALGYLSSNFILLWQHYSELDRPRSWRVQHKNRKDRVDRTAPGPALIVLFQLHGNVRVTCTVCVQGFAKWLLVNKKHLAR